MLFSSLRRSLFRQRHFSSPAHRLMTRHRPAGFRPSLEVLEERTVLDLRRWINPMGGSWHLASNWQDGILPGPSDDVVIPALSDNTVTYSTGTTSIRHLTTSMVLDLTGGSLRASRMIALNAGSVNIKGNVENTGNTLVFAGNGSFTVSGSINGGTVNLLGAVTLRSAGNGGTLNDVVVTGDLAGASWTVHGTILNGNFSPGARATLDRVILNGNLDLLAQGFDGASLTVTNGMTFNGTARLLSSVFGQAQLRFVGTQTIGGTGTIAFLPGTFCFTSTIQVADSDTTLTIGRDITVRGRCGSVGPNHFVNQGTIRADDRPDFFGGPITLDGSGWSNQGTIEARDGGYVVAQGTNWNNSGTFRVLTGSTLLAQGTSTNFAAGILTGGNWQVFDNSTLRLINSGIVTNAANILLDGPNSNWYRDGDTTSALANFATNTAAGRFAIQNGRRFMAATTFTNQGTLTVGTRSTLNTPTLANFVNGTLAGGTYLIGGMLQFNNADIRTNAATVVLDGPVAAILNQSFDDALANFSRNDGNFTVRNDQNLTVAGPFTNMGSMTVDARTTFAVSGGDYVQFGHGAITTLDDGSLTTDDRNVVILDGRLAGSGTIAASVINNGQIDLGGNGTAGRLTITGDFTQTPSGILNLKLGGLEPGSQYDQLVIGGAATLGGTLNVALLDGLFASEGDSFQVLQFGARNGNFSSINGLDLGGGLFLDPVYDDASLTLIATAKS